MKEEEGLFKEVSEPLGYPVTVSEHAKTLLDGRPCTAESVVGCVEKGGRMLAEEQPGCTVGPGPHVSVGWVKEPHWTSLRYPALPLLLIASQIWTFLTRLEGLWLCMCFLWGFPCTQRGLRKGRRACCTFSGCWLPLESPRHSPVVAGRRGCGKELANIT